MKVIPIMPIHNGKVFDISYDNSDNTINIGTESHDVYSVISMLGAKYDIQYFLDLNALKFQEQQIEIMKELCKVNEVWIDPAVRTSEEIIDPLIAGGEWVIVSTSSINSIDELEEAVDLSDRIIPAIHWSQGQVIHRYKSSSTGMEDLRSHIKQLSKFDVESLIFIDFDRINATQGPDKRIIEELIDSGLNVYLGGGVREQDVLTYSGLGASGVLLFINELLQHMTRTRPGHHKPFPHEEPVYEPSIQLNPLGFPEFH